jgi:hypothetical protein
MDKSYPFFRNAESARMILTTERVAFSTVWSGHVSFAVVLAAICSVFTF